MAAFEAVRVSATNQADITILRNLRIWDGFGWSGADSLRLEGRRIAAVGDTAVGYTAVGYTGPDAAGTTVIDCAGAVAVPGLMDAHVHMELNPEHTRPPEHTNLHQRPEMENRARAMVQAGITTARDLGGGAWLEIGLRDAIARGEIPGPRLLCAGQPITTPAGHCHFWGGEAADLAAARAVLDRQLEHDVDLIKVMASGGRMTRGSDPSRAQFDLETLKGIVAMASAHKLPVAAHCHGTEAIEFAARAGVRTIEHCSWVGKEGWASDYQPEVARIILEQGVWVSPTINRGWQRFLNDTAGATLTRIRAAFGAMLGLGIPLVASTDAGIPGVFHHHLPEALSAFSRVVQLSPEATLRSATSDAARALGLERITGRLAPGYDADVLLVDGDPTADLSALTRPVGVWARGRALHLP